MGLKLPPIFLTSDEEAFIYLFLTEQSLQGISLKEKQEDKDKKHIGRKHLWNNLKTIGAYEP